MNILCVNTAFNETYVVAKNNNVVINKVMDSSLKQSENVLGAVDYCLTESGLELNKVEVIACVIGPGSFTGIRIGASLVKGFCKAIPSIQKIEVNSLDLLAHDYLLNNKCETSFWVALNGLSGNIFACKYSNSGKRLCDPMLCYGEELEQVFGIVVGLKSESLDICNTYANFSCESLLSFTTTKVQTKEFSNDFVPLYLRKSQAEVELDNKKSNS